MKTIRDQIKDACKKYGVDTETACLIADELGFDTELGDLKFGLSDAVSLMEDNL